MRTMRKQFPVKFLTSGIFSAPMLGGVNKRKKWRLKVIPLFCTAHNIATSKMAAVLPSSTKTTSKDRFCKAKAFICNNNAADRLTASWFAIENQEKGRNVRDPEVGSGFSLCGRRVVELLKMSWLRLWIMGAAKPVGQLYGSPTALTSQYLAWDRYCTYVYLFIYLCIYLFIYLFIYLPASLDTGLPSGNVHEPDLGPMRGAIPIQSHNP